MESDTGPAARPPERRGHLIVRPLADEWVVFDPPNRRLHVLNLTAALLWDLIDGHRTRDDLARDLCAAYDDPPGFDQAGQAVDRTLADFRQRGEAGEGFTKGCDPA